MNISELLLESPKIYITTLSILILFIFFVIILSIFMIFRIQYKKLNILWPIFLLKIILPFISYSFFGQIFLLLTTIFDCNGKRNRICSSLACKSGLWFNIFGPLSIISIFFECLISIITIILYFKPFFFIGSDILKKTNPVPDLTLILIKIGMNSLFILIDKNEDKQWMNLFVSILFTGINAFINIKYQNRANKKLKLLNNIFSLSLFAGFISLAVGKMLIELQFTGSIYLFLSSVVLIILFFSLYKNREIDFISIDSREIDNSIDYFEYIYTFYNIIHKQKNSRNYYTILESLITEIEANCILLDCPLKKYLYSIKNGIESPYLLNQYCEKLFKYGISKFPNDINLKYNYSIFLITQMNYKNKALMIVNNIKKSISFLDNYNIYRTLKLIEKWIFSPENRNNMNFIYNDKKEEFKLLVKILTNLYFDFFTLLLESKSRNNDNFNKIHEIGDEIMDNNKKIEEVYNLIINEQADHIEIIKLYTEYVEAILFDEEKLEKCQNISKIMYSSKAELDDADFSNFRIESLNEKDSIPFIIVSTYKEKFGKIIDISLSALKIFGYLENEIIGQHINILIPKIFQKANDSMFIKNYENHKFKLFDNLNRGKIYFPEIIKKELYGITKMKFLIELITNTYFVKTEDNKILYIIEITNYIPLKVDLLNNNIDISKYCVLTDDNFLIQAFSSNCIEFLNLNYTNINSNCSIINYIKQFQEDFLITLNNTCKLKYSYTNLNNELFQEEKNHERTNSKKIITASMKKKIKNDLLIKKYSKKCKITWKISPEINNLYISKLQDEDRTWKDSNNIFSVINNREENKNIPEPEKDIFMEIKKITINKEILGYYFYFSKIRDKYYNNMSYDFINPEINDKNNYLIKLKKYKCIFMQKNNILRDEKFYFFSDLNDKNSENNSLIIKSPENNINKIRKKSSLEHSRKVSFQKEENKQTNNTSSLISKKIEDININELLDEENGISISDDYIPEYKSYFTIDLNNMYFIQVNADNKNNEYLDILKNEATEKIKEYQEQLKLISKDSESNESEEIESEEDFEDNSKNTYSSNNISNSEKVNEILKNSSLKSNFSEKGEKEDKKEKENILKSQSKFVNNNAKNDNSITKERNIISNNKLPKINSFLSNFYKVNLNHIHYMIFDFYRDMIIEGNKKEVCSKVENILTKIKNLDIIEFEKDERFSFFSKFNKNKKVTKENKTNLNTEKILYNDINNTKINEEKLYKKRIFETLNKHKDEPPIQKLKLFVFISFFILISLGVICLYLDLLYLGLMIEALKLFKHISFVKYSSGFSTYYLRELSLINFEVEGINGFKYTKYIAKDKDSHINYIKSKLMELFSENQNSLKEFYSSSLGLSPNHTKILSEYKVNVKMSNNPTVEISYDIHTSFMQYSSEFYNLASSTAAIAQDHIDLKNYIYNCLNGYFKAFNLLLDIYGEELNKYLRNIKSIVISTCILLFFFFSLNNYIIIKLFFKSIQIRGNYMKVFYGINENILRNLINNCENLMNRLKSSKEQRYIEEEILSESIEEKINIVENKINSKNLISNLNYEIEKKSDNKASNTSIIFVIIYGLFNLISYIYIVYNGIYMINTSEKSILIYTIEHKMHNHHIIMTHYFNVYREFLFDNESQINDINILKYLDDFSKGNTISTVLEDVTSISINLRQLLSDLSNLSIPLCNYYTNDYFDSSSECQEQIGLITNEKITIFTIYFFEEMRIGKNFAKIKFGEKAILGNLSNYNFEEYYKIISITENNSNYSYSEGYKYLDDVKDDTNKTIFRLDFFNSEILHEKLNAMFFSIILPYIERNAKPIFEDLSIDEAKKTIKYLNISFYILVILIYCIYFIPIISFINMNIYKTKNMLSIVPLDILASQSGVSEILNISKE